MKKVYEVILEPRAERDLDKVQGDVFLKIDKAILALSKNPRPFGVKKLDEKLYRFRVQDWRLIYAIFDKEAKILILRIVRRNEKTYKEL